MAGRRRSNQQRGTLYFMVLGAAMLVTIIGVSAIMATRVRHRSVDMTQDYLTARQLAPAAVDLALHSIGSVEEWRAKFGSGFWVEDFPYGSGTLSIQVEDPIDGDVSWGLCDPLVVTGIGAQGLSRSMVQATLVSDAIGVDPFGARMAELEPLVWWRLGDTDGVRAIDEMGHVDGVYKNGVRLDMPVPFRCDGAIGLDGTSSFVEIPHDDEFLLDDGAVTFWFQAENTAIEQGIFSKDASGLQSGGHLTFLVSGGRLTARLQSDDDSVYLRGDGVVSNAWYFVVLNFGEDGMDLYVNGQWVDSDGYEGGLGETSGGKGNYEPIALGVSLVSSATYSTNGWSNPFEGYIDEVALFGRRIDHDDIVYLYDLGTQTPPHTMQVELGSWQQVVD